MIRMTKLYIKKRVPRKRLIQTLDKLLSDFNKKGTTIDLIFVPERYIKQLNRKFFQRFEPTDVIAFPFEEENFLGEVYISVDTVLRQANKYNTTFEDELIRVSVHGVLHLLGFTDDNPENAEVMHKLEDKYLFVN